MKYRKKKEINSQAMVIVKLVKPGLLKRFRTAIGVAPMVERKNPREW